MSRFELTACITGFVAGLLARWIDLKVSRRFLDESFWHRVASVGRLLVTDDAEASIWQEYIRLWRALCRFVATTAAITLFALLPVLLMFAGLAGYANQYSRPTNSRIAAVLISPVVSGNHTFGHYYNDWEVDFFVAVVVASVAMTFVLKFKR